MKEKALRFILKYMGLCIIGVLLCAAYTPSAFADICFLPGNDCVDDPGGDDDGDRTTTEEEVNTEDYSLCRLAEPLENYNCFQCSNGKWRCNGCKVGVEVNGECVCELGKVMCDGKCLPESTTGNEVLNPNTCTYECRAGYESVVGLTGCYPKCKVSGQVHNATTGRCECPNNGSECNGRCVSCTTGTLDTDSCTCSAGVQCERPKEYLTLESGEKTCTGACHDGRYILKDRFSDGSSDAWDEDYRCDTDSHARMFVRDVRDSISGGNCERCPVSPGVYALNRWRCKVNYQLVENYPDVCFALGYTYSTNIYTSCNSSFTYISEATRQAYDKAVKKLKDDLPDYSNIFRGDFSEECPYAPGYYKINGQCTNGFKTTHGDAVWMGNSSDYTCYECPEQILENGPDNGINMYHCVHAPCPNGQVWDEEHEECVEPQCASTFKNLDPIDLCTSSSACGLTAISSLVTLDKVDSNSDGGSVVKCRTDPTAIYTASQAMTLRANGYFCTASRECSDLYICEPAKPLAAAVRENGGTCEECGDQPKLYQCKINEHPIETPDELCTYLGYTMPMWQYTSYFAADSNAICSSMPCGVEVNQYGRPVGAEYTSRYKCSCKFGYTLTERGCERNCNPYCGYSDSCSDELACITPQPNGDCASEGYTLTGTEREFECGMYNLSSCEKCPYVDTPAFYRCNTSNPCNETEGKGCYCCLQPAAASCRPAPINCDKYSDFYCDSSSDEFYLQCGRDKCYAEGYSDVYSVESMLNCKECPYAHSGNTLYKDCENPQTCADRGYTTPYDASGNYVCNLCPEDKTLGKDCMHKCVSAGYLASAPSCTNNKVPEEISLYSGNLTCYGNCNCPEGWTIDSGSDCEPVPPPQPTCQSLGYTKMSGNDKTREQQGYIKCEHCSYDDEYANCRAVNCDGYPIKADDKNALVNQGYTCTKCPESNQFWKCDAPVNPCPGNGYTLTTAQKDALVAQYYTCEPCPKSADYWRCEAPNCDGYDKTTSQKETLVSQQGYSCEPCPSDNSKWKCLPPDCGDYPLSVAEKNALVAKGHVCTQCPASNLYWKCTDPCAGLTAVNVDPDCEECIEYLNPTSCGCKTKQDKGRYCKVDEVCTPDSAKVCRGQRCTGTCECPGVTCADGESCAAWNKCGGCIQCTCPGETCDDPNKKCDTARNGCGNCPNGHCVNKVCTDYDANYKDGCNGCENATPNKPRSDLTCYTCSAKGCTDFNAGYKTDSNSCPAGQKAVPVNKANVCNLNCYECQAKVCTDYNTGYKTDSSSCPAGEKAVPVDSSSVGGLTCYECEAMVCTDYNSSYVDTGTQCKSNENDEKVTSGVGNLTCYNCKDCADYKEKASKSDCAYGVKETKTHGRITCYTCNSGGGSSNGCDPDCTGSPSMPSNCGNWYQCFSCDKGWLYTCRDSYSDNSSSSGGDGISDGISDSNSDSGLGSCSDCCDFVNGQWMENLSSNTGWCSGFSCSSRCIDAHSDNYCGGGTNEDEDSNGTAASCCSGACPGAYKSSRPECKSLICCP